VPRGRPPVAAGPAADYNNRRARVHHTSAAPTGRRTAHGSYGSYRSHATHDRRARGVARDPL